VNLIVGLGNPGEEYTHTRHNVGFLVLDSFAHELGVGKCRKKFSSLFAECMYENKRLVLVKPQTFMNASGIAVREVCDYYSIDVENVLIVHDDIDLDFGRIKIKCDGGDGGHKGVHSIIEALGNNNFGRIRIGISRDANIARHVLSGFTKNEKALMVETIKCSVEAIKSILVDGYEKTMNRFNYFKGDSL
jgi:PTH1 family peptidyl-tRNA hydrolase